MFYGNHDVYRDFGIASQYACIDRTVSPGQYKKGNTGVIIGIWILAIVVILGGIFFVPQPLSYALGEIAGRITASGLMVHLYRSIDIELDLPEKKAVSHSKAMGLVRSTIEIGVLVGSFFLSKWVMPYTVLAGLLARKAAALMVPWMEKIRLRKKKLL